MRKTGCIWYLHKMRREQGGLTLVEVLVAMLLLSIGILTCLTLLAAGVKVNAVNRDKSHALNLAEQKMEDWKRRDLPGLDFEDSGGSVELENYPDGKYDVKVTAARAGTGFVEVTVTVSWDEENYARPREVRLATIRRY